VVITVVLTVVTMTVVFTVVTFFDITVVLTVVWLVAVMVVLVLTVELFEEVTVVLTVVWLVVITVELTVEVEFKKTATSWALEGSHMVALTSVPRWAMRKGLRERQNLELTLKRESVRESRSRLTEKNQAMLVVEGVHWLTMVALTSWISSMKSMSTSMVSLNLVALEVVLKRVWMFA
jgi:hypothetical protein